MSARPLTAVEVDRVRDGLSLLVALFAKAAIIDAMHETAALRELLDGATVTINPKETKR